MTVSYKRLWKLLIDRDMMKKDLIALSGISHSSLAKLVNNGNVNVSALVKICEVLDCTLDDIVELVPDEPAVEQPVVTGAAPKVSSYSRAAAERTM